MSQQRLFFLNSPLVQQKAEALAQTLKDEPTPEAQVSKAYEVALQRRPTPDELALAVAFVQQPPATKAPTSLEAGDGDEGDGAMADDDGDGGRGDRGKETEKALPDSPLRSFVWALFSSNEFLFID